MLPALLEESASISRRRGARKRLAAGALAAVLATVIAACGGGERQDADEAEGDFPVEVVSAEFPASQRLAQTSELVLTVRNTGDEVVPDLAVTVFTDPAAEEISADEAAASGEETEATATGADGEEISEDELGAEVDQALEEELAAEEPESSRWAILSSPGPCPARLRPVRLRPAAAPRSRRPTPSPSASSSPTRRPR
jgi:hypothetical protein